MSRRSEMPAWWRAAAAASVLILSGCASLPDDRPDDLPAGKPAVTVDQAALALAHYDEVRASGDAEALEAVETGVLLETTRTSLALAEARDEEPEAGFRHTDVVGYSPRFTEYPMWFVSTSTIDNDPGRVAVQVLTRENSGADWIVHQAAGLGAVDLPEIAATDGEFTEPGELAAQGVEEVLDELAEYLSGGDSNLDLDTFSNYREWVDERTIDEPQVTEPSVECERDERAELRVVPTQAGVLGVATMTCTITQEILDTVDATMSLGGDLAALAPETGRRVEFRSSHPVVVSVPDVGEPEVFSGGWRWAEVSVHEE